MKEYSLRLDKTFARGLRKEATKARNVEGLTYSMNAAPSIEGLVSRYPMFPAFPTAVEDFPFPQVFFFRDFTLMGQRDGVYELQGDGSFFKIIDQVVEFEWDILDFGPYILVVNSMKAWERDIVTGSYSLITTLPKCTSIEDFKGQLITGGDITDSEGTLGRRVSWGNIGSKDFTIGRKNIAGYAELFDSGYIHKVLAIEGGFIAYAENSITLFYAVGAPLNTFGKKTLLQMGVGSKGSVCKGQDYHLAVLNNGDLYEFSKEGAKYLGYSEFFDSFGSCRITYNPDASEFYISNGFLTYVYSDAGLGQLGQVVTSGGMYEGDFYAMVGIDRNETYQVVTDTIDMSSRGQKTLYAIELSIDSGALSEVAVYWRVNVREGFRRSPWVSAGPSGIATVIVTGIEFRLAVRVLGGGEVNLSSALIRWKLTDKRSIRGQYGESNVNQTSTS